MRLVPRESLQEIPTAGHVQAVAKRNEGKSFCIWIGVISKTWPPEPLCSIKFPTCFCEDETRQSEQRSSRRAERGPADQESIKRNHAGTGCQPFYQLLRADETWKVIFGFYISPRFGRSEGCQCREHIQKSTIRYFFMIQ